MPRRNSLWGTPPKSLAKQRVESQTKLKFVVQLLQADTPPPYRRATTTAGQLDDLRAAQAFFARPLSDFRVLDSHQMIATSRVGLLRGASEWASQRETSMGRYLEWWGDWWFDEPSGRAVRRVSAGWLMTVPVVQASPKERKYLEAFGARVRERTGKQLAALRAKDRRRFDDDATAYFRMRIEQFGGDHDESTLHDADKLYDLPGLPAILARALRLTTTELRNYLGRRRAVYCARCGVETVVLDPRCKGGYTEFEYTHMGCGGALEAIANEEQG
jgi:hypothetical protein